MSGPSSPSAVSTDSPPVAIVRRLCGKVLRRLRSELQRADWSRAWVDAAEATFHRYRGSVVEVDGIVLKMDRSLSNLMANVLRHNQHAVEERALVLPALAADDVVMELGGGVGHTSTRFAKAIGCERVFTFEANPELEPLMRENFRLNGVNPTAEFCMLGRQAGRAVFYVHRHFWTSSRDGHDGGRRIEVPVHPINQRIRAIDPSFLVVDIEGGERDLFDGLDFHNVRKLMLELHENLLGPDAVARVLGILADAGFVLDRQVNSCRLFRRDRSAGAAGGGEAGRVPTGDGIEAAAGKWRFEDIAPDVFDRHIAKSIPGYLDGHEIVVRLAAPCVAQGGRLYELGCSTGALTAKLAEAAGPQAEIVGIDQVASMLEQARRRCAAYPGVSFEHGDVCRFEFADARVVVSYYTLHFIPVAARSDVVVRVRAGLDPQGLFILFERVRDADPVRDRALVDAYHAFKAAQGFTADEIRAKAAALEGVLVPQTEQANIAMLREAGFTRVEKVFEQLCWQGYAARP